MCILSFMRNSCKSLQSNKQGIIINNFQLNSRFDAVPAARPQASSTALNGLCIVRHFVKVHWEGVQVLCFHGPPHTHTRIYR
jgi:hypothetical protein